MKVNVQKVMTTLDDEPIKMSLKEGGVPEDLRLKDVLIRSVLVAEPKLKPEESLKRFTLAQEIKQAEDEIDLKPEELVLLKDQIGKAGYSPLIGGQAIKELNG